MRVLHVGIKNYPPSHGGVEKFVFDITNNCDIVSPFFFVEWEQAETDNIKVLPKKFCTQVKFIHQFVSTNKVDIIHFHKETFIPHALLISLMKHKVVITIHGCAWRIKRWPWYYRFSFYVLDALACIFIKSTVFVGLEDFLQFSKNFPWKKKLFIPNGIKTNNLTASQDTNKCVYIGRISPEKNILNLISIFSHKSKELTIYGPFDKHDTSYKEIVLHKIANHPNIKYAGVLPYTEVLSTLSKFNTFYNISYSEGMPVSVLEAASVGLNLVLSIIPQHKDLKFPDVIYVDPENPFLDKIFNGISIDNKIHIKNKFSLTLTINKYLDIYNRLLKTNQNGK